MFIPHHSLIHAPERVPERWMFVLHGIYGKGQNWRSFARQLTERRPDWGVVLVDLRMHGRSMAAPGPHSVAAAAADLHALADLLARRGQPVHAVCGHSFGGKVALRYRAHDAARAGASAPELLQTWVIDSSPSTSPHAMNDPDNTVVRVLDLLTRMPAWHATRADFLQLVAANGFPEPLGHWLAMNLERRDQRYVFGLEPPALDALLRDYYGADAWPWVEAASPGDVHVIIADRSPVVSPSDRMRLSGLAAGGANLDVTVIRESGHWVHIEALEPLLQTVAAGLPRA